MKRIISFLYVKLTLSLMFIFMSTLTVLALEQPSSYTQGYEDHFLKGDGSVENYIISNTTQPYYTYNEDEGTVSIYRENIKGVDTFIEHSFKPPKNFDIEFRLKKTKVNEPLYEAHFQVRVCADTRYAWLNFGDGISYCTHSEYGTDLRYRERTIPYNVGYDWFTLKGEFRGQFATWYIDGKEILRHEVFHTGDPMWCASVGMTYSGDNMTGGFSMDWQKYTPYFDDSFYITQPTQNQTFEAGSNITFDVNLAEEFNGLSNIGKMVDYYINGFSVGQGKYSGGFQYTLTGAKPGIYRLTAKCSDGSVSGETVFTVKKAAFNSTLGNEVATDGLGLAFVGKDDDTWYTYKIVVGDYDGSKSFLKDHNEIVKVYRKARGGADSEYKELTATEAPASYTAEDLEDVEYFYNHKFTSGLNDLIIGYYNSKLAEDDSVRSATEYSIDNLQVSNDDISYSGYVTNTDAEIFVDSDEEIEALVLASYDDNGVLFDIDFAELNGGTNFADLNIKAGALTKLYIWNGLTAGKPLLEDPIEMGN